jgi:hypothetical protein
MPGSNVTERGLAYTRSPPIDWTKHRFSLWVESVKKEFKVGQLVTLKVAPPQPNVLPFHFRITDINEVHHFATWDRVAFEPEAIMLQTPAGVVHKRAPSVLRHLTEEELRLVILQDTEPRGTA